MKKRPELAHFFKKKQLIVLKAKHEFDADKTERR